MKDNERNWLSLKEYEYCYPIEYLEFLNVFEQDGKQCVLLDSEAIKIIDLLNEKTERLKNEKLNDFLNKKDRQSQNPFPLIFTGIDDKAYNVFMDFKKNITDYYPDYSFIFQKMKSKTESLIQTRCRHKEFMDWLFENKHISEKVYKDFIDKESFSNKYDRGMRPTMYNSIKEKHFPFDSDLSE